VANQGRIAESQTAHRTDGVVLPLAFVGDDAALVKALRADHPGAKAALFDRYAEHVERIVTHVLGFDSELADVLHDAFVGAFASIHTLEDPSALKPWLSRVAAFTARKVLRTRSRRAWLRLFKDAAHQERSEPVIQPNPEVFRAVRETYAVLDELPIDERIAFALRFIEGMELSEAAASCGVSLATIKRRIRRAERRFRTLAAKRPTLTEQILGGSRWRDQ
jgi:RNA polymerase sigma-70 factor (ECF subfamily)